MSAQYSEHITDANGLELSTGDIVRNIYTHVEYEICVIVPGMAEKNVIHIRPLFTREYTRQVNPKDYELWVTDPIEFNKSMPI